MDPLAALLDSMPQARAVYAAAEEHAATIYLVGGAVRDVLLAPEVLSDKPELADIKDLDFAVVGPKAVSLARVVADKLGGHFVLLDEDFDCARVVLDANDTAPGLVLDFAGCQGKDIAQDLARRDFTINAIAYDRKQGLLLDPTGGVGDLKQGLVRMVSEGNLAEDPLRVLRAYRFACLLDFDIEEKTAQAVALAVPLLSSIARERINFEVFTLLNCANVGRFVHQMGDLGLFEIIFEELRPLAKSRPIATITCPCLRTAWRRFPSSRPA